MIRANRFVRIVLRIARATKHGIFAMVVVVGPLIRCQDRSLGMLSMACAVS